MKYEITKGCEKDFTGAPEWAEVKTRTDVGEFWLQKHSLGGLSQLIGHESTVEISSFPYKEEIIAERRPITEPVWDGEGLPPVGSKVMTKSGEGVIDYVGVGVIVYTNNDGQWSVRCDSLDFSLSAIRSPEDVARDESIDDLVETMIYFYGNPKGAESYRGLAVRIIEAIEIGKISRIKME